MFSRPYSYSRLAASPSLMCISFMVPCRPWNMPSPAAARLRPDPRVYRSQVVDHRGLIAGLCDALGRGDVLAQATHHNPALRDLTAGEAVTARGLTGLGCIQHALDLGPRCVPPTPTSRRMAPRVAPHPRPEDARGRAFEPREAEGVTALERLMAVSAATRLGLPPPSRHRDTTSGPVAGRDHSVAAPTAPVGHRPTGARRAHRPARQPVLGALMGELQAGRPVRLPPLSGHRRAGTALGHRVRAPSARGPTTDGTPDLGAARARSRDDPRPQRADPHRPWMTRVPAP
jgi:hypothetical protein